MSIINDIKSEFEAKYPNHDFKWKDAGRGSIKGLCPAHDDHNQSLSVSVVDGQVLYNCWSCEFKGRLSELSTAPTDYTSSVDKVETGEDPAAIFDENFTPIYTLQESHVKDILSSYIRKRGLNEEDIQTYNIHVCVKGKSPYFMYIGFPFRYDSSKTIFFTARKAFLSGPKYLLPKCEKGDKACFYYAPNYSCPDVVLVEGVMDAIKVHKAGFNAMILFGKVISDFQIEAIKEREFGKVTVFLDKDAFNDAKGLDKLLRSKGLISIVKIPSEKDPGDMNIEDIKKVLADNTFLGGNNED